MRSPRSVTSAFGSPNEARLVDAIRDSSNYVPEWSLVAVVDGRVVGHVMVSYVTLRDASTEHRVPSLSPLSVDPGHQGSGIGSALVRTVAALVDSAEEPMIVLEGSPRTTRASASSMRSPWASPSGCPTGPPRRPPRCCAYVGTTRPYGAGGLPARVRRRHGLMS